MKRQFQTLNNGVCFVCLSDYWHRNLHNDGLVENIKILSAYEQDTLPLLWRNVLFKNNSFCEHVVHAWLTLSVWRMKFDLDNQASEKIVLQFVQKEALRLEGLMDAIMEAMRKKQQISDCKGSLTHFTNRNYGKKQQLSWFPSDGPQVIGSWHGLAEALIEQYCCHLELEDVHEREQRLLIWKHFALALTHNLISLSPVKSRSEKSIEEEETTSTSG